MQIWARLEKEFWVRLMEGSCHLPLKYFYHVPNICHGLVKVQCQIFYAAKNGGRFLQESTVCAELRNVNSFTQSKNLKINFTPRKARKSQQFWYLSRTKLTKRIAFENKCWKLNQIRLVYTQKSYTSCSNLPKIGLHWPNNMPSQTFYPNLPIFLHEYIRHIRDILQLCACVLVSHCRRF